MDAADNSGKSKQANAILTGIVTSGWELICGKQASSNLAREGTFDQEHRSAHRARRRAPEEQANELHRPRL
jgi:hypothetical protein